MRARKCPPIERGATRSGEWRMTTAMAERVHGALLATIGSLRCAGLPGWISMRGWSGPHATAFPDVSALMQPSDSLVPVGRRSGRPSPTGYPGAEVLFFTAAPVPPPTGATPETFLPRLPISRLSPEEIRGDPRCLGHPLRACRGQRPRRVRTAPRPSRGAVAVAFRRANTLGTRKHISFVAAWPTAHSLACQYFVGFSRPPQGVVDLSHAVVLGNEERTHPLYPFIAPAPRFNVIDGPRAMRPVPTPPGFGERSGPHKRVELAKREPRTLTHVVLKQHGCPGRVHTAPRIRTPFGASVAVTKRHHCAMIGRRRSSRSVRT